MKAIKSLSIPLLSAIFLAITIIMFAVPADAATCTCQQSSRPHDSSHNKKYVSNGDSGHLIYCYTCTLNGHSADCAQVILENNVTHTLSYSGTGSSRIQTCSVCDYSAPAACDHTNAKYVVSYSATEGESTDNSTCIKYCSDCKTVVSTKKHSWQAKKASSSDRAEKHALVCKDCKYERLGNQAHSFKYTYKKPAQPSNPATSKIVNSEVVYPSTHHTTTAVCTKMRI